MTLTELRYIIAAAKERHFGKAARQCFVCQPTLSLGIKKLEDELDVILFERGQKEITITPAGRKIVEQAERAIQEINAIKEIAKQEKDPLATPLRVGAIYTIGPYLFPSMIPFLLEKRCGLPLLIEENYTANLIARLHAGDIDVAIISMPFNEPGLETRVLYEEPFVVLLPNTHPLTAKNTVDVHNVAKETVLLLGPKHCFRDQVLEICPDCVHSIASNDDLQSMLEGGSLETIRYMVAGGVGITILPVTAACAERYTQRLISVRPFEGVQPFRRVALAWRKGFPRMEAVRLIADSILECNLSGVNMLENGLVESEELMVV